MKPIFATAQEIAKQARRLSIKCYGKRLSGEQGMPRGFFLNFEMRGTNGTIFLYRRSLSYTIQRREDSRVVTETKNFSFPAKCLHDCALRVFGVLTERFHNYWGKQ